MPGGMTSLLGGQTKPYTPQPTIGAGNQQQFMQALQNMVMQNGQLQGVAPYTGQLSPTAAQTPVAQAAYGAYSPTNAATNQLQGQLGSIGQANPQITQAVNMLLGGGGSNTAINNLVSGQGGAGGYATKLMQNLAGTGSTGGAGGQAMNNIMQFGAPSQNAGSMGLANLAQGLGPQMSLLAPFLQNLGIPPTAQGQFFKQPSFTPPKAGG